LLRRKKRKNKKLFNPTISNQTIKNQKEPTMKNQSLTRFLSRTLFIVLALLIGNAVHSWAVSASLIGAPVVLKMFKVQLPSASGFAFAGIIDPTDLTFNGKEAMSLSETVYENVFEKPGIRQLHAIMTGIKAKQQIPFLGLMGLVGKKKGACDITPNPNGISMSEKFWDPSYVTDRFEECWATLKESFFIWGLKNGIKKEDLTGTDFAKFFEERLSDAMLESVYRIAWFGDTAGDTISQGGDITNGTDTDYFTIIKGIFAQLYDIVIANPARRTTIARNAQATYANQLFDATDTTNDVATKIFQNLKFEADYRLRSKSGLVIISTLSLIDQYERERTSKDLEVAYMRLENGMDAVKVGGIPVIPFQLWDRYIDAYYNNGTKWLNPHRALLTTVDNIPIGTEEEGNLAEMDPFYDKVNKKYICDFGYNIDAKVLKDEEVQFAY
jgi:hypothetical protein